MMMEKQRANAESGGLNSEIDKWKFALTAIGAALVGGYFVYFSWLMNLPLAENADKWGAFGDYFGGLMNPVVAFAAFYWLTRSVKLQKEELAETRHELKEAASAQKALVANGSVQVQLAALTALANAASDEMAVASTEKASLRAGRSGTSGTQSMMYDFANAPAFAEAKAAFQSARKKRDRYLAQMEAILAVNMPSAPIPDESPDSLDVGAVSKPEHSDAAGPDSP